MSIPAWENGCCTAGSVSQLPGVASECRFFGFPAALIAASLVVVSMMLDIIPFLLDSVHSGPAGAVNVSGNFGVETVMEI